jgi:hypothetical protein
MYMGVRNVVEIFLWLVMGLATYQEHKELLKIRKDLAFLVLEFEEEKKRRVALMKKLFE